MLAAHYAFNVTYAPNIASTMMLLQKLILRLNDDMKPPSKVLRFITKLKKTNLVTYFRIVSKFRKKHYSSMPNCRGWVKLQILGTKLSCLFNYYKRMN